MQEKIKWAIVIFLLVLGGYNILQELNKGAVNPKDELVFRKCLSGYEYAMNNKGYKRPLMDENNNPLRCRE